MTAPAAAPAPASGAPFDPWHYDGETAIKRRVGIEMVGATFLLVEAERRSGPFAFADLQPLPDTAGDPVYALDGRPGWRLGLSGAIPAEQAAQLPAPQRYGGVIDRWGLGRASMAFAAASAAVIALVLAVPQIVAPLIPPGTEQQLGEAMVGDFGGRLCHTPAGDAARAALVERIAPGARDIRVDVAKIDMVNAVALPGGRIILFQGLVDKASGPDEIAGVIAHEVGHVRERHVMQALLRQFGLSVVLGGLDGNIGGTLNGLLSLSYGRDAERQADGWSIRAMQAGRVSPRGTAAFFERMARETGEKLDLDKKDGGKRDKGGKSGKDAGAKARDLSTLAGYFSTHPLSRDRRAAFLKSEKPGIAYTPALDTAQWQALKSMCADDRTAKSGMDFGFD